MYSMYQMSYYNGNNYSYSTSGYCQGSMRNSKSSPDITQESSHSCRHKTPSNTQTPGRYQTIHRPAKTFVNAPKKWTDKSSPSTDSLNNSKIRHSTADPMLSSKQVDRKNDLKKNKSFSRKPAENKENVHVKDDGTAKKGNAGNYQGRKQQSEIVPYSSSGPGKTRYREFYSKQWIDSLDFINSNLRVEKRLGNADVYSVLPSRLSVKGVETPMYRFLQKSLSMVVKDCPEVLTIGSQWDELSTSIWSKFIGFQQCEDVFRAKILLWEHLYIVIRAWYPRYGLYLVGSTFNGFGIDNSDVDLCLMIHNVEIDQRNEAQIHLNYVFNILMNFTFIDDMKLIHAKVPLLKFRDINTGLYVDLNCNNSVGMRNTHLLYCYSLLEWRVRPLVVLVKLWAQRHNINDAKSMTLSSYSLSLMVIHFLQSGVIPPVLPCLQKLCKSKFDPSAKISSISIMNTYVKPYKSENKLTLGELFLKFFQYYATFNFAEHAVSVRLGGTLPVSTCRQSKSPKNDPIQWKFISIEEPFDLTNTARSVHDLTKFQDILNAFRFSAETLANTKSLDSIMNSNTVG